MTEQDESMRDLLELDPVELDYVRRIAAEHDVSVTETTTEGFEPVTTVTLVLMGSALAVATVTHLVERHRGGQVIDLMPHAARPFYRSRDLQYGLVAVLHRDGTVSIDVKQPQDMFAKVVESLAGVLTGLGKASLEAVSDTVQLTVGERGTVSVQPAPGT